MNKSEKKSNGIPIKDDLVGEFNELVSNGRMHLNLVKGVTVVDLTDDEKINIMEILKKNKIIKNKGGINNGK